MNNFDPYFTLGLNKSSNSYEIKKAYKHLAKKYHPDKNPHYSEKFIKLQIAYEVLMGKASLQEQNHMTHNELKKKYYEYDNNDNNDTNDKNKLTKNERSTHNKNINLNNHNNKNINLNNHDKNINLNNHNKNINLNALKTNLNSLKTNLNSEFNFDKIEDYPITKDEFTTVLHKYMSKRNVPSIERLFSNSFDLSIFNQIYSDLKKESKEIIIKEPESINASCLVNYSYVDDIEKNINEDYNLVFKNNPNNPNNKNIIKKYKSNDAFIRDDILDNNYNSQLKDKINSYNNFKFNSK